MSKQIPFQLGQLFLDGSTDSKESGDSKASEGLGASNGFGGAHSAGDRATLAINGVEFAFRYCPAGEF